MNRCFVWRCIDKKCDKIVNNSNSNKYVKQENFLKAWVNNGERKALK